METSGHSAIFTLGHLPGMELPESSIDADIGQSAEQALTGPEGVREH